MKFSENAPILSVVVPVAPADDAWRNLLHDLRALPIGTEIIFSGPITPSNFHHTTQSLGLRHAKWITSGVGRAAQQNQGAMTSRGRHIWFLHADSRISQYAIDNLSQLLQREECRLYYFNLRYIDDGPVFMAINTLGAWIRSHVLNIPFGDQGFCMRRDLFHRLGGFNESCLYGEDHLLVWSARRSHVLLRCVGDGLATSARKYRENGWLGTTFTHFVLTVSQALPEFGKFIKERLSLWRAAPLPHLSKRPDYPQ